MSEMQPPKIPYDYFGSVEEDLGWHRNRSRPTWNAINVEETFDTEDELLLGHGKQMRLSAAVSIEKVGDDRLVSAEFDQTISDGAATSGTVVNINNESEEGEAMSVLIFDITVLTQFPRRRTEPARDTMVVVTFGGNYRLRGARLVTAEDEDSDDKPSYEIGQYIDDTPEVAQVLRRLKLTDPLHQRLDPVATMQALVHGVSTRFVDGRQQPPSPDILDLFVFTSIVEEKDEALNIPGASELSNYSISHPTSGVEGLN